jgi:hypothetical protein
MASKTPTLPAPHPHVLQPLCPHLHVPVAKEGHSLYILQCILRLAVSTLVQLDSVLENLSALLLSGDTAQHSTAKQHNNSTALRPTVSRSTPERHIWFAAFSD